MPKISVIIPAYNAQLFIERAVNSLLCQSHSDLEIIIIDDGSQDSTADVCKFLADKDSRVRVVTQENGGVSVARNNAIALATGELIAFLDADDSLEPEAYSKMLSAMQSSGADCAISGYFDEYPDGTKTAVALNFEKSTLSHSDVLEGIVLPLLQERICKGLFLGTIWRYLFRRETIVQNSISFTGAYLEDEVFLIEYFAHACSLAVVDEPLYNYLQNPSSATRKYMADFTQTFERTMELKKQLVEKFQIPVGEAWIRNSAWAGLLIAVSNEFAPNNPNNGLSQLVRICDRPLFSDAIKNYKPKDMSRNKQITAFCIKHRQYALLATLYAIKNGRA